MSGVSIAALLTITCDLVPSAETSRPRKLSAAVQTFGPAGKCSEVGNPERALEEKEQSNNPMAFESVEFCNPGPTDPFWKSKRVRLPLTDKILDFAKQQFRLKPPMEHLVLIRIQNGGRTNGFDFPMTEQSGRIIDHIPLNDLAGMGHVLKLP